MRATTTTESGSRRAASAIAGYCGGPGNAGLDEALAERAEVYADLTERDHGLLAQAVGSGRLPRHEDG